MDQERSWRPLTALPAAVAEAAEGVGLARETLQILRQADQYRIDDFALDRVIERFTLTTDELTHVFAKQGRRWRHEAPGTTEQAAAEQYRALVEDERALVTDILSLAGDLKNVTIERLHANSSPLDAETLLGDRLDDNN